MTLKERMMAPTPPFYEGLRNIGLNVFGLACCVLIGFEPLPFFIWEILINVAVAGMITAIVSQSVTAEEGSKIHHLNKRLFYGQ